MLDIDPNKQAGQNQARANQSWNTDSIPTAQALPKKQNKNQSQFSGITLYLGVIAVCIVVIGAGVWGLQYYKNNKINDIKSDISNVDTQISKLNNIESEALALQSKYENVSSILNKRQIWTSLIDVLGDETLKKASFTNLSTSATTDSIELSGNTDTLTNLAKLIVAFQNSENFTDIQISSFSPPSETNTNVSFGISLGFNKSLISPESKTTNSE
ncbi:PilN domain-containing protein [Patescibacteria group bacterium]